MSAGGLCFFLRAEDGIRDGHVTGVQTCALPISRSRSRGGGGESGAGRERAGPVQRVDACGLEGPEGLEALGAGSSGHRDRKSVVEGKSGGPGGSRLNVERHTEAERERCAGTEGE